MKRFFATGAIAAGVLAVSSGAYAQNSEDWAKSSLSGRIGAFIPFEGDLRDLASIWFALGLDLEVPGRLVPNAQTVVSLDWNTHTGGQSANIVPITISQRFYSGDFGNRTWFQVGIGASVLDFSPSDLVFSAKAGIGFEFKENYFLAADIFWTDKHGSADIAGSGIAGYIGIRF
ncbi:MAG: hypothetical protein U0R49_09520 [Fimbriimonadales bacterium]